MSQPTTIRGTIKELMPKIKINGKIQDQFFWGFIIKVMEEGGFVKNVGSQKASGGKGRPAVIWEIPDTNNIMIDFRDAYIHGDG